MADRDRLSRAISEAVSRFNVSIVCLVPAARQFFKRSDKFL